MPYKSFKTLKQEKNRLFFYTPHEITLLENKSYFAQNTAAIKLIKGYEVDKIGGEPINNKELLMIVVQYFIGEYFGDYTGRHVKERSYILIDGVVYKESGEIIEKLPSELEGVLKEYNI
ncbi:hypothetical protein ACPWSR_06365 [Alloiococcus sp. CFN-8]|uniref:hypothetical protein n=1 Tax=Alloiococcus sp. CFN-8 TaxID=3416081 RepID=UPI003CEC1D56